MQKELLQPTALNLEGTSLSNAVISKSSKNISLNKELALFGFAYHSHQNLFYSIMDGWQRECGYCELYDEGAAALSMIIDCEPVYFEYDGKKWLIEFWKGQYGMTTGCEIGIYNTTGPDLNIPGIFNGTFFYSANDEDHMDMGFTLYKNNKPLFYRNERHWWITSFRLGEFSNPEELIMHAEITLKNAEMRDIFVRALEKTGYKREEITVEDNTVRFIYDKPKSKQPITRTPAIDYIMQSYNRLNCTAYTEATKSFGDPIDKIFTVKESTPNLYEKVVNVGNTLEIKKTYEKLENYIKRNTNKSDLSTLSANGVSSRDFIFNQSVTSEIRQFVNEFMNDEEHLKVLDKLK